MPTALHPQDQAVFQTNKNESRSAPLSVNDPGSQMALWLLAAALQLDAYIQRDCPEIAATHKCLLGYRQSGQALGDDMTAQSLPARLIFAERIESKGDPALPFTRAAGALGLTETPRLAFALAALAEEDAAIGAVLADLQGNHATYPAIDTVAQVLAGPQPQLGIGWDIVQPLVAAGLLTEVQDNTPRARRMLAPASLAWDIMRGMDTPQWPPGSTYKRRQDMLPPSALCYRRAFRDRLSRITSAIADIRSPVIVLRHMPGTDTEQIAGAIAYALGHDLIICRKEQNTKNSADRSLQAAQVLTDAIQFRQIALGPGETFELPMTPACKQPTILALGTSGGLAPDAAERAITLHVPFPTASERGRAWRKAFGTQKVEGFTQIRDRFQLPLGYIRRAARAARTEAALAGRATVAPKEARSAIRTIGREQLDTMADFLTAQDDWDRLIVPAPTRVLLRRFADRCLHREPLSYQFNATGTDRGVRTLFSGPSGTGKTLAARLLGGEIGTDVYRLNLAAVVDKYVGETEKRLAQLFARAEALDVILLLDEGDGLMAQRTDVRSANDRFANLETNFLLQRLESHAGIVVVTTNMPDGIDPAFQRRMDLVIPFPRPAADSRLSLWQMHLPDGHQVTPAGLKRCAALAALTGGQIRNAVRTAASLAMAENRPLCDDCLMRGIDQELQKAGAMSGTQMPIAAPTDAASIGLSAFGTMLKGDPA